MNTAEPISSAAANGRCRSRSKANRDDGDRGALGDLHPRHDGKAADDQHGDHEERCRQAERLDQHRRQRRAGGEAGDVGRQHHPQVAAQVGRVGEDDDAADGRVGHPDPQPHDEPRPEQRRGRLARGHPDQAHHVEHQPCVDQAAGVAAVGERGDQRLGDERGDEADGHDQPQPRAPDPVVVTEVVEHREHHAVAGGHQRGQQPERQHPPSQGARRRGVADAHGEHATDHRPTDRQAIRRRFTGARIAPAIGPDCGDPRG